jgi:alginate O-acetyltransferase complex protein AlgJ
MLRVFSKAGVNAADLNSAFQNSSLRSGEVPFYFRLDSHWTPIGAMVGAEALKKALDSDPKSAERLASIPTVKYTYKVSNRKRPSRGRDLVDQLPPNAPAFAPELLPQVNVVREDSSQSTLLGAQDVPQIGLVGSSYSRDWTGFSDAVRYVLQRDVLVAAVGADQGSWVGMESYLKNEAFQTNPPKLLIWEMPERDMRAPPDYKYRDARYVMGNAEWLKKVTDLVNKAPAKP